MPTTISWTDETLNPIASGEGGSYGRWGCAKISPGCDFCYASRLNQRFGGPEYPADNRHLHDQEEDAWHGAIATLELKPERLLLPLRWHKPRHIFVADMTDVFGRWVPDDWIDQVIAMAAAAPHHTFQILTKRAGRLAKYFADKTLGTRLWHAALGLWEDARKPRGAFTWPLPNLWLGVSIESGAYAWRANHLRRTPAAVRFISAEPLLDDLAPKLDLTGIHWLIAGGESGGPKERALVASHAPCTNVLWRGGPSAHPNQPTCPNCGAPSYAPTPLHTNWVRNLRDKAKTNGTAFFLKQWGGPKPHSGGDLLDGRQWHEFPA